MASGRSLHPRRRWLLSVGILVGLLIGWPALARSAGGSSDLIHACVNPSKLVRIVEPPEGCHPSERALAWPAALATAASLSLGGGLRVVDKAGQPVGPLVRPDAVLVTVSGERVLVGVQATRFFGLLGVALYFQEPKCTGGRLVSPATDTLLPWAQVMGTTAYFGGRDGAPYAVGSMLYAGSSTTTPVCYSYDSPYPRFTLTPAKSVELGGFTPPFSVQ